MHPAQVPFLVCHARDVDDIRGVLVMSRASQLLLHRPVRAALVVASVAAVFVAPTAVSTGSPADAVVIGGARNLSDKLEVHFQAAKGPTTDVHLLAWNDFHGNLEPGTLNLYGQFAGGAAWLAKAVEDKQAQYGDKQITVFGGDNIGASPLVDGLFFGEPATTITNLMHADFASVGNHEFDKGKDELLRIQNGGCRTDVGCTAAPYALASGGTTNTYPGADFQYLSANVVRDDNGETLFPAYGIKRIKSDSGKKLTVGIIGAVLEATPTIVTPAGVAGLTFLDEADAANRAVADLKRQGVNTSVLVIHQGGFQAGSPTLNGCAGNLAGSDIEEIVKRLDPSIRVIVSAHTHAEYRCTIQSGGATRLITSASSFGRVLSDITLRIEDKTGVVTDAVATNAVVRNSSNAFIPGTVPLLDLPKDDRVAGVVQQYVTAVAPLANQVIGKVTQDILNAPNALGEIPSGDVIADAQLVATQPANLGGAQIAFMNPGGIRGGPTFGFLFTPSGSEAPGEVTYGEAFTVQPFGNSLVTKTMTGAQIHLLLEQQFVGCGGQTTQRILQISAGFSWVRNASAPACADKVSGLTLNGQMIDPAASYRVTMNNFLASGGDGFTVFNQGTNALGGAQDIDALVAYFNSFLPNAVPSPPVNRITGT
jgi:5'-nucleotidase